MIVKCGVFVLLCIVATSQAAILGHRSWESESRVNGIDDEPVLPDYGSKDYQPLEYDTYRTPRKMDLFEKVLKAHSSDIEFAMESIYFGTTKGFGNNLVAFLTKLNELCNKFYGKYVKASLPLLEAIPADVLKEWNINILKAVSNAIEQLETVVTDYNPLHPVKSADVPGMFGRELTKRKYVGPELMTLSVWGVNLGKAIGVADDVIVDLVKALVEQMKTANTKLKEGLVELESIPASALKNVYITVFQQMIEDL